jgi:hypothetical protein
VVAKPYLRELTLTAAPAQAVRQAKQPKTIQPVRQTAYVEMEKQWDVHVGAREQGELK